MNARGHVGWNPYLGRGRVGAPLIPAPGHVQDALSVVAQYANAQGQNPALLRPSGAAMRGSRETMGFPLVSLNGVALQTGIAKSISQGEFRAEKLVIGNAVDSTGQTILVTSIFVGAESCLVNSNPVTSSIFTANAVDCSVTFPTAGPGIEISVTVQTIPAVTNTVVVTMIGAYIKGSGREIAG
jgi:hypothetical protein